ncbi:TRAP transporter small permease [Treponema parvum]|uniref:TRAP transporter small permease n=1 Tax=Treponema parvum TaxID=138851 RepID=A0A975EXX4_9SPIR|nr:TRAP transporter small permease [Treponema parvum]QTQ11006.1 TRAP transporter small permease [Treponema parvum]QTQ17048.1 TRAP transporter small permease [Treponema parvum]
MKKQCGKKCKIVRAILSNLDFMVASLALTVLIILTFLGVIMRYVLGSPFTWLEEVQLFCMVWIVFAAAGGAFRTKSHVAIEMVVELFPLKLQKATEFFIDAVVVAVLLYLFYQSIGFVSLFVRSGRSTSMLGIPYTIVYGIAPVSCIVMLWNYFRVKYRSKESMERSQEGEEK